MGLFLHAVLFPNGNESNCRGAIEAAANNPEMGIQLDQCKWHLFKRGPAVLIQGNCSGYDALAKDLSENLPQPVMVLYIYDDDFWGYYLWHHGTELDRFATVPDYFGPGEPPDRPGNAQVVTQCFGQSYEIDQYLLPWREDRMDVKAYDTDNYAIGDCWQMTDFMSVLGFNYDRLDPPEESSDQFAFLPAGISRDMVVNSTPGHGPASSPEPLANALTSLAYAVERAEELGEEICGLIRNMSCQSALPLLTAEIKASPDRAASYILRAYCWSRLEGKASGMSRKPDIDRDLSKALDLEPDNVMILRARCPTTATTSRYKRHIGDLTRLMALDSKHRDQYQIDRAYRYHWVGDHDAARADLQELLQRKAKMTVDLAYLLAEYQL